MTGENIFATCFVCLLLFGMYSNMNSPEYKAKEEARRVECLKPKLVSEAEGVKLYAINYPDTECPDRPVYFSKSGTKTTHTERHGKTTRTYDDEVSAGGQ